MKKSIKLIKFGLPTCAPCKLVSKQIEKLLNDEEIKDYVDFYDVDCEADNIEHNPVDYDVTFVPLIVIENDEGIVEKFGAKNASYDVMKKKILKALEK